MIEFVTKVVKVTLSGDFQIGYEFANVGMKNMSFFSMEEVLIELTGKGTLDDKHKQNIQKWTKEFIFTDIFAVLSFTSL